MDSASPLKTAPLLPGSSELVSAPCEASAPVRPLRVVAIGGGTGLSTLLRGLRRYVSVPDLDDLAES